MMNDELADRILDASDDDPTLHAAYRTGSDDDRDYWLVVAQKTYEEKEMLKIRYFAADHDDPAEDTWMQNGVTARKGPELVERFACDFPAFSNGVDEFFSHDLVGSEE